MPDNLTTDACKILEARYGPVPLKYRIWMEIGRRLSLIPILGPYATVIFHIIWDWLDGDFEDERDILAARKAMADPRLDIPWEDIKAEFGL